MDDVTLVVNHNVAIVPVLDLENVARERIRRHGTDKVEPGLLVRRRLFPAILVDTVKIEVVDVLAAHFVARGGIWHNVNHTTLRSAQPRQ